jgi:hypothetical protein
MFKLVLSSNILNTIKFIRRHVQSTRLGRDMSQKRHHVRLRHSPDVQSHNFFECRFERCSCCARVRTRVVPVYSKAYGTSTPYGGFMNDWATTAVKKRERMCDAGVQLGTLSRRPLPLFSLFFHSSPYPSHCIPHLFQRLFSLLSTCHYWSRETIIFSLFFFFSRNAQLRSIWLPLRRRPLWGN